MADGRLTRDLKDIFSLGFGGYEELTIDQKKIVDEQSLRKAILEESYIGGESRKLKGLVQLIKDAPPEVAKKNTETLQKVLYEGALEEAYDIRSTKGLGYTDDAVEVLQDGSKQLKKGRLHEELEVDSGAFQLYLSRNKSILEEIFKEHPEFRTEQSGSGFSKRSSSNRRKIGIK